MQRECLNDFCREVTDTECPDCHGCEYCCTCADWLALPFFDDELECDFFECESIADCFECEGCFDHCTCEDEE